jgi:hypothetical protein
MSNSSPRGVTVLAVTALHHAVLMSIAFVCTSVALGGPLGVLPAEAALLAEARRWRDDGAPQPGSFARIWTGSTKTWWQALPGAGLLVAAGAAFWLASAESAAGFIALAVVMGLWLLLMAQHGALLLSLGRPAWIGWPAFLLSAWLALAGILLWLVLAVSLLLPLLPLTLGLGPALVAWALVRLEIPVTRLITPRGSGGI